MPKPTERALLMGLIAALPLALAPLAEAQTSGPKRMKVPGAEEPVAKEPAVEDAAAEELKTRVLPEAEETAAAEPEAPEVAEPDAPIEILPEAEEAAEIEVFPEGDAIDSAEAPSAAEPEPAADVAEPAAEAEPETGTETAVVVTDEEGPGPFVGDYTLGDPEAPVQVIEYASFTCPHCAAYHRDAWGDLKSEFVDSNKIGFTLREVYFDRFGLWASMTARCGGEDAFYPMADQFLKKQDEWTKASDIAGAIAQIGRLNGLTDDQLKICLENQDFAKLLVEDYQTNAAEDEVRSTPTFIIRGPNGSETVVGNRPDEVRAAIEQALAGS